MKRRAFIAALGGAVAWPLTTEAQQPAAQRRIVIFHPAIPATLLTETARALRASRGVVVAGRRATPASSASSRSTTSSARATPARSTRRTATAAASSASTRCHRSTTSPTTARRSTWWSCARRQQRTPSFSRASTRRGIRATFVTSAGYAEAGDEGRQALQAELVALGQRARDPPGRPQRSRCRVHLRAALRADRRAVPTGGTRRCRQPIGELRLVVPQLLGADRCRREPGRGDARQRRDGPPCPTTSTSTPMIPPPPWASRTWRPSPTAGAFFDRISSVAAREAARAAQGRRDVRRAGAPRPVTPARSQATTASSTACAARPAPRRAATVEAAFEAAAATFATQPLPKGPARRGAHDGGRLGSGDCRRDHRVARSRARRAPR